MITEYIDFAIERLISETNESGGSSVHITGKALPTRGFMVGGVADPMVFNSLDILSPENREVLARNLLAYVSRNETALTDPHTFLGAWIDQKEGRFYVDISEHVIIKEYAEELARDRKELAIWDVANSTEIRL